MKEFLLEANHTFFFKICYLCAAFEESKIIGPGRIRKMDTLLEFSIPVSGLKEGIHSFDFQLDSSFFEHFPESIIKKGSFWVQLNFEKRIDFYQMGFSFEGTIETVCDRCLAAINFPVKGENRLIIKFAEDFSEEGELIYIPHKTEKLNVARYIYEFIHLAIPFVKIYNCQEEIPKPCDEQVLQLLEKESQNTDSADSSVWDQLKDIKFS